VHILEKSTIFALKLMPKGIVLMQLSTSKDSGFLGAFSFIFNYLAKKSPKTEKQKRQQSYF
jgi:hypothetical protein